MKYLIKVKLEKIILIMLDMKKKIINFNEYYKKLKTNDVNCEIKQQLLKEI